MKPINGGTEPKTNNIIQGARMNFKEVKMKKSIFTIILIMGLITPAMLDASVYYVHPESTQNCIQDCLNACATGDTVLVGPGFYTENIHWPATTCIKLLSEYGRDTTTIDGGGVDRTVHMTGSFDTTTVISGFKITNGYAEYGGGIMCEYNNSPIIENNFITNNIAYGIEYGHGGGIGLYYYASPIIRGNIISKNQANGSWSGGGGIAVIEGCAPVISDNIIEENYSTAAGAGIMCHDYSSAVVTGNTIRKNTSPVAGGGICMQRTLNTIVIGNTITENDAPYGAGLDTGNDDSSLVRRNIISSNINASGVTCGRNNKSLIDSCIIVDNEGGGVYLEVTGNTILRHNNIINNPGYAVLNVSSSWLNAKDNWWGDASGPFHPDSNPSGLGDTVSNYVSFYPWLNEPVAIGIKEEKIFPKSILTTHVYPNPFKDRVLIQYQVSKTSNVNIVIFDLLGKKIRTLVNNKQTAGKFTKTWDGKDESGNIVANGVYFLRYNTENYTSTKRLLKIR